MGRMHKKKIAEYTAAENEKAGHKTPDIEKEKKRSINVKSRNSDANGALEESESFEENGVAKSGKKRKTGNAGESRSSTEEQFDNAKKSKKETLKSKAKGKGLAKELSEEKDDESIKDITKIIDEEEYEVETIVDHKIDDGISYFLVRWKGYGEEDDTWEPEDTLSCDALIAKYNKQIKNGASGSPKGKKRTTGKSPKKVQNVKGKVASTETGPEEYEVEKIINYAEEKSGRQFLIRWKGYSAKYDTWEPEHNLNCADMINKFMQRMQSQQNANFKELRQEPKKVKRLVNETAPRSHYKNSSGRSSKRAAKKRVYYGDSDD